MRFSRATVALGIRLSLGVILLTAFTGNSLADVLHFHSGKILRGKVSRVTGEIIEFTEGDSFGSKQNVKRLTLSNRCDIVETRKGEKYFGEIVYIDKFKIDMQTGTGMVKINRLRVSNVIMGTPMEQPTESTLNRIPLQSTGTPPAAGNYPLPGSEESNNPPMAVPGEDEDAIPAVDRTFN